MSLEADWALSAGQCAFSVEVLMSVGCWGLWGGGEVLTCGSQLSGAPRRSQLAPSLPQSTELPWDL